MGENPLALSEGAEIALLILAANGGVMQQDDCKKEWMRVMAMTEEERAEWRRRIQPLVNAHAARHFGSGE